MDVAVERSLREFWSRHTRWAVIRFRLVRPGVFLEPLLNPTVVAAAAVACAPSGARRRSALAATISSAMSMVFVQACGHVTRGRGFGVRYVLLFPLQQAAFLGIWLRAATKRSVSWQGHRRVVGAGTRLSAGTS
jgi:hypothetical protein